MYTAIAIALGFVFALTLHELGHYQAMRFYGIRIREVSVLGIPIPGLPRLKVKRGETTWTINPLPIGAYVMPYELGEQDLGSLWRRLHIYGSGPLVNLCYGCLLMGISNAIVGASPLSKWVAGFIIPAILVWVFRRYVVLVLPVALVANLYVIAHWLLTTSPGDALAQGSGGPVAIVAALTGQTNLADALFQAGSVSIGIGVFNLLPLFALDGGKMVKAILDRCFGPKVGTICEYATLPLFLGLLVYMFGLDIWRVGSKFVQ